MYGVFDSVCPSLALSPYENKIGGYPDFYEECLLTSAPTCVCCHAPLVLLVQVYCPLESSPYHRLLHIFCCTKATCWGEPKSWLVLRSQSLASHVQPEKQEDRQKDSQRDGCTVTDWCDGADDWGSDADVDTYAFSMKDKLAETAEHEHEHERRCSMSPEAESASLNEATGGVCGTVSATGGVCGTVSEYEATGGVCGTVSEYEATGRGCGTVYRGPYYYSAYIRTVEGNTTSQQTTRVTKLLDKYRSENPDFLREKGGGRGGGSEGKVREKGGGGGGSEGCGHGQSKGKVREKGGGGSEGYEKSQARHGDQAFLKFQKELLHCPQQIIRYQWKGTAVPMTDAKHLELPKCSECGASRVFECQLMPALVYTLQTLHRKHLPPPAVVEFGTVIVYSCSASCWETLPSQKHRQEIVIVHCEDCAL